MESEKRAFHTVEYGLLRQELNNNAQASQDAIVYSIVANAALVAWISVNIESSKALATILPVAAWLPILITLSAWFINVIRRRQVSRIGDYCFILEKTLGSSEHGWGVFYLEHRISGLQGRVRARHVYDLIFILQMALSVYFLLWIYFGTGNNS